MSFQGSNLHQLKESIEFVLFNSNASLSASTALKVLDGDILASDRERAGI